MTLANIIRALGGDMYDRGLRANIPAPNHSPDDRSVSLTLSKGRVIIHSFGSTPWTEVADALREKGLIDANNRLTGAGAAASGYHAERRNSVDRQDAASRIWELGRPAAGTLTERHARLRKIRRPLPGPETLRHVFAAPISAYTGKGRTKPALVVAIRDTSARLAGIEITYLDPNGRRAAGLRLSRKMIGSIPPGSAVRLDDPAPEMLVGEGLFTTLSATERFQLPGWALMSTALMRTWTPPPGVKRLLIAADHGPDGVRSATMLRERAIAAGVSADTVFPDNPEHDWNDAAPELSHSFPKEG